MPTTFITKFATKREESRTHNSYVQNSRTRVIFQFLVCHVQVLRSCLDVQRLDAEEQISGLNRVLMTVCYLSEAM